LLGFEGQLAALKKSVAACPGDWLSPRLACVGRKWGAILMGGPQAPLPPKRSLPNVEPRRDDQFGSGTMQKERGTAQRTASQLLARPAVRYL